ncbi:MAG: ribosome-associated translation inhibitor RaiA [Bacteroidales bacterium]|nr:ribosome-associated translation inhibitor RaiA [Bacteroidales bacterium]
MEIKIKTLKFDADQKLVAYVEKKVAKLDKFFKGGSDLADVTLSLLHEPENKQAKIQIHVPGEDLVIERNADTFEQAITDCVDAMKEKLTRTKEKKFDK